MNKDWHETNQSVIEQLHSLQSFMEEQKQAEDDLEGVASSEAYDRYLDKAATAYGNAAECWFDLKHDVDSYVPRLKEYIRL